MHLFLNMLFHTNIMRELYNYFKNNNLDVLFEFVYLMYLFTVCASHSKTQSPNAETHNIIHSNYTMYLFTRMLKF